MAGVPQINFKYFSIKEIKNLWNKGEVLINKEYQRSEIWKSYQKKGLIDSIMKGFSIGVLVIWKNREDKFEILDGQQRIKTIIRFLNDEFKNNENKKFTELTITEQSEIEAYSIFCLKLKSDLKEEEVSDIFTRLQEGTPLNISEKVNAFRGEFRKSFIKAFLENELFFGKLKNYRFRARFLAAQFLILELTTDFEKKIFPNMRYIDFKEINKKYKNELPVRKITKYNNYIKFLGTFLQNEISAISYRDWIALYLLASYLDKKEAKKIGAGIYFKKFTLKFMENLTSFSIYDASPPKNMNKELFEEYMTYKEFGRKANQSDSIEKRFNIILSEYERIFPKIRYKDKVRLFNEEQKIRIYFKQKCLSYFCKKPLDFSKATCNHKNDHAKGGLTKIKNGRMAHATCHDKFHNTKKVKYLEHGNTLKK